MGLTQISQQSTLTKKLKQPVMTSTTTATVILMSALVPKGRFGTSLAMAVKVSIKVKIVVLAYVQVARLSAVTMVKALYVHPMSSLRARPVMAWTTTAMARSTKI